MAKSSKKLTLPEPPVRPLDPPPITLGSIFVGDLKIAADILEPLGYHLFYDGAVRSLFIHCMHSDKEKYGPVPDIDVLERVTFLERIDLEERMRQDPFAVWVCAAMCSNKPVCHSGRLLLSANRSPLSATYAGLSLSAKGYITLIHIRCGVVRFRNYCGPLASFL